MCKQRLIIPPSYYLYWIQRVDSTSFSCGISARTSQLSFLLRHVTKLEIKERALSQKLLMRSPKLDVPFLVVAVSVSRWKVGPQSMHPGSATISQL
ncbi:RLORF10 [Gallid alphaherpesvirus 2]|nr:hypothetical protein [Gallid alphaherpesvirus 2]ACF49530.1 RLORF10 [synthetic construct]AEV54970.1 RLORF10 [Gallid herpesvirus 2 strain 814]ABF72212.1 R-LORF10 [Gallid alphaherpesvirus 2]ABF72318.1 R-LORF10 [Gallid alphaherpesvirus 2]